MSNQELYIDTETCGLTGPVVLIQYAEGDGDIHLFSPWENPASESIRLIEWIFNHPIVGFNLAFDIFHLYKWWTMMKLFAETMGDDGLYPDEHIETLIDIEELARDYPQCLKPVTCLDLFLHARKGPYQSLMDRKDIRIKKIPTPLAWKLAEELEKRIPFRDIYFARRKGNNKLDRHWQIEDRKDSFGDIDPDWKNIVVRFKPSSALKALAVDTGIAKEEDILAYGDISPKLHPVEVGYAPFAKAAMQFKYRDKGKEKKRRGYKYKRTWPDLINQHIEHWGHNDLARKYAKNDIVYTRALRQHKDFVDAKMGDDDSILAAMVGIGRWRGYRLDLDGIKQLKQRAQDKKYIIDPITGEKNLLPTAPRDVKRYILDACDPIEKLAIMQGESGLTNTRKITLENLAKSKDWNIPCPDCDEDNHDNCARCKGKGSVRHEASIRARQILDSRKSQKEEQLYDKLLLAGRLHASVKVIGARSGRMSGTDGLNPQGMNKAYEVKEKFLFAWPGEVLCGGDANAYEVTIGVAVYDDSELQKDLLTCERCKGEMVFDQSKRDYRCLGCGKNKGQKIHALAGTTFFPPMTYEEICATDGKPGEEDKYTRSKSGVFTLLYFGGPQSLMQKLGVTEEAAKEAERRFIRKYKGVGRSQERIRTLFGSMRQPAGRGTKVEWHEPAEKMSTLFGFNRYFTLENQICRALFDLASEMPKSMSQVKLKVQRTDRQQTMGGAACSAIYSAAFNIQSYNVRAAGNHEIQGTGAQGTKMVQRRIWDLQPSGIHKWLVQPMNIHDSIMTPVAPEMVEKVEQIVSDTVEEIRPTIPLIKWPWDNYLAHWADKGKAILDGSTGKVIKKRTVEMSFHLNKQVEKPRYRLLTDDELKQLS